MSLPYCPRSERALRSLDNTLELLSHNIDNNRFASTVDRIVDLIDGCDFLDEIPGQTTGPAAIEALARISYRPEGGLLPPTAFVFQAMPADDILFPAEFLETENPFSAVIHKTASASIATGVTNGVIGEFKTDQALVTLADLDHPFAQAIAGADIFSKLHGYVDYGLAGRADNFDDTTLTHVGTQIIQASSLVRHLVEIEDTGGNSADWYDGRIRAFRRGLRGGDDTLWAPPPTGTTLHAACQTEPAMIGILSTHLVALSVDEHCIAMGESADTAALNVSRILFRSQLA